LFEQWVNLWEEFFIELGLKKENLRRYEHQKKDLAHYAKRTIDIEYKFPFGWSELAGIANRTDFDLSQHSKVSGEDLRYFDEEKKEKYFPYVVEPTVGIDRLILALLSDAYQEIKGGRTKTTQSSKETEVVLTLDKKIAPIKVAVLPLVRNKEELRKKAKDIYNVIRKSFYCQYDDVGSIGRRYRRQDEIGTPFCVTIDFDTLKDDSVTVRDRDTMKQQRVGIKELAFYLEERLKD